MKRLLNLLLLVALFAGESSFSLASDEPSDGGGHEGHSMGQMRRGRYYGYIKMDGRPERIALQADFFLESPEDFTQYPKMEAILKLSLGGYHTKEYTTAVYRSLRHDPEGETLAMDEPANDLVITTKIHSMEGQVYLMGKVWSRSSASGGVVNLRLESDEPGGGPSMPDPNDKLPFTPLLDGQYNGRCSDGTAIFQMQTMHGLRKRDDGKDFFDYEMTARIAYPSLRGQPLPWSVRATFAGGSYDPYRGKLKFSGPSSTAIECSRTLGKLSCDYRIQERTLHCDFSRPASAARAPGTASRAWHLNPADEQARELPLPGAVPDSELAELLAGDFHGYLHNEEINRYQAVTLHIDSSISTENPHNPNKVFVSGTAVLHFGRLSEGHFFSQRYEPRSFYVRPGFALNAAGTDSFFMIEEWKKGFIRGIWYSQEFGRVGTVELVKGPLPTLPAGAETVPSWQGEFSSSMRAGGILLKRWFQVISPNQPAERLTNTLQFNGSFQSGVKVTPIEAIERGAFDPYTLAFGWSFSSRDKGGLAMVSGHLAEDGSLLLFWPPVPNVSMTVMGDYLPQAFRKESQR